MAATTEIRQYTGSGPSGAAITNLRHKTDDNSSGTDTTYPLVKPSSGTNYGYIATLALACTTAPAGTINNVKFYTDGTNSYGTGVTVKGITTSSYAQATGTQGTSGDLSSSVYTAGADIFGWTSGSPLSVAGSLSNPSTGKISDYVRMQMALSTSVTPGTTAGETLTFRYDET